MVDRKPVKDDRTALFKSSDVPPVFNGAAQIVRDGFQEKIRKELLEVCHLQLSAIAEKFICTTVTLSDKYHGAWNETHSLGRNCSNVSHSGKA